MVGGSLRVTGMTWSERSDWRFDDATWSDLHLDSPKVCGSNVETINWYSTVECTGGGGGFFWGGPSWSPIEGSIKHPQLKCIIHIYFQLAIRLKKKHFKFGFETERESASHQHRDPIMDPSYYGIQNPLQKLLFIFPCKTRKKIEQRLLNGNEKKRKEKTAEKNGRRTEPPESTEENGGRRGVQAACGGNENWKEHTHTTEKKNAENDVQHPAFFACHCLIER